MDRQVKIKVWHLVAVLILVFFIAGISGQSIGAKIARENIKEQESIIDSLKVENKRLSDVIKATEDATANDKEEIKTFENEYRYERSLRLRLQMENAALRDAVFSYSELDSIADNYWFKRN